MEIRPVKTNADYERALREIERLWDAKTGTPEDDKLDVLVTLVEAYEEKHFPMDPPDPIRSDSIPTGTAGTRSARTNRRDRWPQSRS